MALSGCLFADWMCWAIGSFPKFHFGFVPTFGIHLLVLIIYRYSFHLVDAWRKMCRFGLLKRSISNCAIIIVMIPIGNRYHLGGDRQVVSHFVFVVRFFTVFNFVVGQVVTDYSVRSIQCSGTNQLTADAFVTQISVSETQVQYHYFTYVQWQVIGD